MVAAESAASIGTLRLKVKRQAHAWLNAAAIQVNAVWNFANETSYKAARGMDSRTEHGGVSTG